MANKKNDPPLVDQLRVKFLQLSDGNKQRVTGLMVGLEYAQKTSVPPARATLPVKRGGQHP
ncbi:MAG: hypothetical protein LBD74_05735 [Spirochaetaceae bacterium]|nr:hypothetical protein [Spirochaetaceae bacterium]